MSAFSKLESPSPISVPQVTADEKIGNITTINVRSDLNGQLNSSEFEYELIEGLTYNILERRSIYNITSIEAEYCELLYEQNPVIEAKFADPIEVYGQNFTRASLTYNSNDLNDEGCIRFGSHVYYGSSHHRWEVELTEKMELIDKEDIY